MKICPNCGNPPIQEGLIQCHTCMTNRIANEFEEPRIKEIVAQVAAMQASNLLNQQISPEIENFRTGTSNTLAQFDNSLQTFRKESTNALADVRTATEFALIVSKAQNDDAVAFNQLQQIANWEVLPLHSPQMILPEQLSKRLKLMPGLWNRIQL